MAESYGVTGESRSSDNLFAGDHPTVQIPEVLGSGAGSLVRGQLLGRKTADNKFYKFTPGGSDGTEVPRAILVNATDAISADAKTTVFVHGEFNEGAIDWNGADAAQKAAAKRTLLEFGIYVKTIIPAS